ncbi:MAG: glycosyltransferase 87 family protein [Acidimicrobiales bacterium]
MGGTSGRADEVDAVVGGATVGDTRTFRRRLVTLVLLVAAAGCYVGIVVIRLGPPAGGDTAPLTGVTSALANGDLRVAASVTSLPNPPGYPLLAAPLVAAFPSFVGSPTWCTPAGRVAGSGHGVDGGFPVCGVRTATADGGPGPTLPPWYRAQGVLGVASWLVLAIGALALLRAAGADSLAREAGLLVFLAFLPASSSAIVQLYHPQDIVSLGLSLGGLSQVLRRRWLLAGALFGAAVLSKQIALLVLVPALVVVPGRRPRLATATGALVVFGAGILPFLVVDPRATLENLSGFSAGGAAAGQTIVSLMGVHGTVASAVARDAPMVFAVGVCIWAASRRTAWIDDPTAVVALALVCTGSRLVFESVIFPYYLLAASVLVLLLDLVARRSPVRSLAWCAAAAFFVALHPDNEFVAAFGTFILAIVVVVIGAIDVVRFDRSTSTRRLDPAVPLPGSA